MPYRLISPLTRLYISIKPAEPLNLSLTPLEKKIIKEFKEHTPVHEISQNFQLNIADIYKIINQTRIVKIKIGGRYTPDIKKRFQEASRLGRSIKEIIKIFHLEKSEAYYLNRHFGKKTSKKNYPLVKNLLSKPSILWYFMRLQPTLISQFIIT